MYLSEAIEKLNLTEAFSDSLPDWFRQTLKRGASRQDYAKKGNSSRYWDSEYFRSKNSRQFGDGFSTPQGINLFRRLTQMGYDVSNMEFVSQPVPQSLSDPIFSDPDKLPVMHVVTNDGSYIYIPGVNDDWSYSANGRNRKFANFNKNNIKDFVKDFGYIDLTDSKSHIPQSKIDRDKYNYYTYSGDQRIGMRFAPKPADGTDRDNYRYDRLNRSIHNKYSKEAESDLQSTLDQVKRQGYYYTDDGYKNLPDPASPEYGKAVKDAEAYFKRSSEIFNYDKSGYYRGAVQLGKLCQRLQVEANKIKLDKLPKRAAELYEDLVQLKDALLAKQQILIQNSETAQDTADAINEINNDVIFYKRAIDEYLRVAHILENPGMQNRTLDMLDPLFAYVNNVKQSVEQYKTRSFDW